MDENDGIGPSESGLVEEHPGTYAAPKRRRWIGPFAGGIAVGALLLSVVWGLSQPKGPGPALLFAPATSGKAPATTFTLTGTFSLYGTSSTSGGSCQGSGGYSDIADGASVTVYDAGGTVIATGEIMNSYSLDGLGCSFSIHVSNVPINEKFYQIEVTHRGKVTVSADDAKAGRVTLTLGH